MSLGILGEWFYKCKCGKIINESDDPYNHECTDGGSESSLGELSEWFQKCFLCGEMELESDLGKCLKCDDAFCQNCLKKCEKCGHYCKSCSDTIKIRKCQDCDQNFCDKCQNAPVRKKILCKDCIFENAAKFIQQRWKFIFVKLSRLKKNEF